MKLQFAIQLSALSASSFVNLASSKRQAIYRAFMTIYRYTDEFPMTNEPSV